MGVADADLADLDPLLASGARHAHRTADHRRGCRGARTLQALPPGQIHATPRRFVSIAERARFALLSPPPRPAAASMYQILNSELLPRNYCSICLDRALRFWFFRMRQLILNPGNSRTCGIPQSCAPAAITSTHGSFHSGPWLSPPVVRVPQVQSAHERRTPAAPRQSKRQMLFEPLEERSLLAIVMTPWNAVAPMPTARGQAAAATDPSTGLMYVAGGYTFAGELSTVEVYNPGSNSWAAAPSLPMATRGATAEYSNGNIFVFGGYDVGPLAVVQRFNIASNTWSVHAFAAGRWEAAAAATNGKIYVTGGEGSHNQTIEFDPVTLTSAVKATRPNPSQGHESGVMGGYVYTAGGYDAGSAQPFVDRYDPVADSWSTAPADLATATLPLFARRAAGQLCRCRRVE